MALPLRERSVPKESSVSSEEVDVLAGAKESESEEDSAGQGREEEQEDHVEFSR